MSKKDAKLAAEYERLLGLIDENETTAAEDQLSELFGRKVDIPGTRFRMRVELSPEGQEQVYVLVSTSSKMWSFEVAEVTIPAVALLAAADVTRELVEPLGWLEGAKEAR